MVSLTLSAPQAIAATKSMAVAVALLLGMTAMAHCNSGCQMFTDTASQTPAEDAYTAAINGCAATAGLPGKYDRAKDLDCRAKVDCAFKITCDAGLPDGGLDASQVIKTDGGL